MRECPVSIHADSPNQLVRCSFGYWDDQTKAKNGAALFLDASLFNHSCEANASSTAFGDVKVFRARKAIQKGEEVCIAYSSLWDEKRERVFAVHFPDGCSCSLCASEQLDGKANVEHRKELLGPSSRFKHLDEVLRQSAAEGSTHFAALRRELENIVNEVKQTYANSPKRSSIHYELADVYTVIALSDLRGGPVSAEACERSTSYLVKALEAYGMAFERSPDRIKVLAAPLSGASTCINCLLVIAKRYADFREVEQDAEARKWIVAAAELARIVHGDAFRRFRERYCIEIANDELARLIPGCKV